MTTATAGPVSSAVLFEGSESVGGVVSGVGTGLHLPALPALKIA